MFRLVRFEVYKLFRLRSVRLGLLFALLLPFLWALARGSRRPTAWSWPRGGRWCP